MLRLPLIPLLLSVLMTLAGPAHTASLFTPHFTITIVEHCGEGVVGCDDVTYVGISKATGKSITGKGTSLMHMCPDGITPCRHLGYQWRHGNVVYTVTDEGDLLVKKGAKVLVKEHGEWRD